VVAGMASIANHYAEAATTPGLVSAEGRCGTSK
jgi:hypothetical protein